jgi:hypothetical protein
MALARAIVASPRTLPTSLRRLFCWAITAMQILYFLEVIWVRAFDGYGFFDQALDLA